MVLDNADQPVQRDNAFLREDLQASLNRSHIDPAALSTFQRILLTTDGTVTDILEAYLCEPIQIVKLSEKMIQLSQDLPEMDVKQSQEVIARKVLLRGKISYKNFIYAESILVPERLTKKMRDELIKTKTPIGKVWLEHRVENFREIIASGKQSANLLANYFDIKPEDKLLVRTYCVYSKRKPTMMITEKFPESYFLKSF